MNDAVTRDQRRFVRIAFEADVQLRFHLDAHLYLAHLKDISLKGALVETHKLLPNTFKGKMCHLVLPLNETGDKIVMDGLVVHHEGNAIGLECKTMDVDSVTHLRRIVEMNAGDEAVMQRELGEMLR